MCFLAFGFSPPSGCVRRLSLALLCLVAVVKPAAYAAPNPGVVRTVATAVETNLVHNILGVWFPRAIDREHGGYYENFSEDWTRQSDNHKSLVCQSRLIWTTAQAAMRYPERRAEFTEYSKHGFTFLRRHFWDSQFGGFYWGVDETGQPTTSRSTEKHVYGIGFGIYSAVSEFQATHDPQALALASEGFRWLEKHAHDQKNRGYFEVLSREGHPLLTTPANDPKAREAIGTP